jgi:hypothetical protein
MNTKDAIELCRTFNRDAMTIRNMNAIVVPGLQNDLSAIQEMKRLAGPRDSEYRPLCNQERVIRKALRNFQQRLEA